jgi:hypothetical protein
MKMKFFLFTLSPRVQKKLFFFAACEKYSSVTAKAKAEEGKIVIHFSSDDDGGSGFRQNK